MKTVKVSDREFSLLIPSSEVRLTVKRIADKINSDYKNKEVVILPVVNGGMIFASDLVRLLKIPAKLSCIRISSYEGTKSTTVKQIFGLNPEELKDRNVIVVEDIVETGKTLDLLVRKIKEEAQAASVAVATFLFKPQSFEQDNLNLSYVGYEIPDDFVIGYGMDYNGYGRQYEDIFKLI